MKILSGSLCLFLLALMAASSVSAQKLTAEEIVAKHLDSIAVAGVRASTKTLIAVGPGTTMFTSKKDNTVEGRIVLASDNSKTFLGMNMNSSLYRGETFAFNGNNVYVGFVDTAGRSVFGNFVESNNFIVSEGLIGGVLTTAWAVGKLDVSKAKMTAAGIKKIDGKEVYAVEYTKKGGSDLEVVMYFDKETFRHVKTEYKRMSSAAIGTRPEQSSGFTETRFLITEEFGDFKVVSGLTLPHSYRLFYSVTGGQGTTGIEWKFALTEFALNQKFDPTTFDAPKK